MDYNDDGKLDLIAGDTAGNVWLFLNDGTKQKPHLAKPVRVEAGGKQIAATRKTYKRVDGKSVVDKTIEGSHKLADTYTKLHMADWDGDGLKDLLIGHNATMVFYKNEGTASKPSFADPVEMECPDGRFPFRPSPYVVDWDGDKVNDLLVGSDSNEVTFYRNKGTNKKPELEKGEKLELKGDGYEKGFRCRLDTTDWNNDGKLDLLVGNYANRGGNIWLFLRK